MKNILIVEDNKTVAFCLRSKLDDLGFNTVLATTFQEAKDITENTDLDIFVSILDLVLPDSCDGGIVDFILSKKIPSIVLSGDFTDDLFDLMTSKDIVDFVVKNREEDIDYVVNLVTHMHHFSKKSVLVVDDSKVARINIINHLQRLCFKNIIEAQNGLEALELIENNPNIKLIITDFNMPKKDGFELTLDIRKKYSKSDRVIIGETAYDSKDVAGKFLKYGANGYLAKPFSKDEFNYTVINTMEQIIEKSKTKKTRELLNKNIISCSLDLNGVIKSVSLAFLTHFRYKYTEIVGEKIYKINSSQILIQDLINNLRDKKNYFVEVESVDKEQNTHWSKVNFEAVYDEDDLVGVFCIFQDITDKKELIEKEILLLQETKKRAFGEILGNISHHWRQPLSSISMVFGVLEDILDEKQISDKEIDEQILKGTSLLNKLSSKIEYFSNYFYTNDENKIESISIKKLLDEILFIYEPLLLEKKIFIVKNYDLELYINSQKEDLLYLISNILQNSIENFLVKKIAQPIIKITLKDTQDKIYIFIKDNGNGINEDIINSIFDPYFSTKEDLNGTGVGLYLSKLIVEKMLNGTISVENKKNGLKTIIMIPKNRN